MCSGHSAYSASLPWFRPPGTTVRLDIKRGPLAQLFNDTYGRSSRQEATRPPGVTKGHRCSRKDAMARRTYGTVGLLILNMLAVAALSASDPSASRTDAAVA